MLRRWFKIRDIHIGERHRSPDMEKVRALSASIREHGLLHLPSVRFVDGVEFQGEVCDQVVQLITGRHRLLALEANGETDVECQVYDVNDVDAELMEIDENLARAELSPAEEAAHVHRRSVLWEKKYGKPQAIGGRASAKAQGRNLKVTNAESAFVTSEPPTESFTRATAEATGKSMRTVQAAALRAKELGAAIQRIAGTSLDKTAEMDALIKLPETERTALIDRAAAGEKVSARPPKPAVAPEQNDEVAAVAQVNKLFRALSPDGKRAFMDMNDLEFV